MEKDTTITNDAMTAAPLAEGAVKVAPVIAKDAKMAERGDRPGRFGRGGPRRSGGKGRPEQKERIKPEFETKIINIRRVTRVAAGGRRFNFSVAVVSGDRKGRVGVGTGKAGDTSLAIDKATRDAKKNMIKVSLTSSMSIPHEVEAKYCSAIVKMSPAPGRGLIAGSSVRDVLLLAGIKDTGAKLYSGTKNKLNNARVAVLALSRLSKNIKEGKGKVLPVAEQKS
jgi:small subunit ribosomal protein S5